MPGHVIQSPGSSPGLFEEAVLKRAIFICVVLLLYAAGAAAQPVNGDTREHGQSGALIGVP